jgi:hypothetical protein
MGQVGEWDRKSREGNKKSRDRKSMGRGQRDDSVLYSLQNLIYENVYNR